jgi:hypothetical protein
MIGKSRSSGQPQNPDGQKTQKFRQRISSVLGGFTISIRENLFQAVREFFTHAAQVLRKCCASAAQVLRT